ncbi:MAG: Uma2 family endonuclease [Synechococcales bacterium]|nr:Uma2 family endonuclease [Synechococcales bacterium]
MVRLDAIPPPLNTVEASPSATPSSKPWVNDLSSEAPQSDGPSVPPTNLYSDEPPLETDLHRRQIDLLIRLLEYWWRDRDNFYISGNLTVYYSATQTKKQDFRGPDVFIVLDTEKHDRRSWTIWEEEGKYPNVVIELLSDSTATVDRTTKKKLYQTVWRLPEYYWFDPGSLEFKGFRLSNGKYKAIAPNAQGRLRSIELDLELGIYDRQLRWFATDGTIIPLPEEIERQARSQAEQIANQERQARSQAEQIANQERQAKERLEAYLRSQGIDPNQLQ